MDGLPEVLMSGMEKKAFDLRGEMPTYMHEAASHHASRLASSGAVLRMSS